VPSSIKRPHLYKSKSSPNKAATPQKYKFAKSPSTPGRKKGISPSKLKTPVSQIKKMLKVTKSSEKKKKRLVSIESNSLMNDSSEASLSSEASNSLSQASMEISIVNNSFSETSFSSLGSNVLEGEDDHDVMLQPLLHNPSTTSIVSTSPLVSPDKINTKESELEKNAGQQQQQQKNNNNVKNINVFASFGNNNDSNSSSNNDYTKVLSPSLSSSSLTYGGFPSNDITHCPSSSSFLSFSNSSSSSLSPSASFSSSSSFPSSKETTKGKENLEETISSLLMNIRGQREENNWLRLQKKDTEGMY
jgi:hypothetical protein